MSVIPAAYPLDASAVKWHAVRRMAEEQAVVTQDDDVEPDGKPRVYLAGPDVFLPDARDVGAAKVALAAEYGLVGVFPLDGGLDIDHLPPAEQARRIALTNEALMRSCDAAIANLTPFRGASMDSGTAYEVGFMRALGRPVLGYTASADDYARRAVAFRTHWPAAAGAVGFDTAESMIEDFGLAENLMIAIALSESGLPAQMGTATISGRIQARTAFESCLAWLTRYFEAMGSDPGVTQSTIEPRDDNR